MRSRDKIDLTVDPMYGKEWLTIRLKKGTRGYEDRSLVPSFEDHFRIICGYAHCELRKYPNIDPIPLLQNFFTEATEMAGRVSRREIGYEEAWDCLATKYLIRKPARKNGQH